MSFWSGVSIGNIRQRRLRRAERRPQPRLRVEPVTREAPEDPPIRLSVDESALDNAINQTMAQLHRQRTANGETYRWYSPTEDSANMDDFMPLEEMPNAPE
jgi:hypothetical protein